MRGTVTAALLTLRRQLEQVERSAAWRYGHGTTRMLARVRRRRTTTAGGVAAALGQVDRTLELLGSPRPAATSESLPQHGPTARTTQDGRPATAAERILLGQRIRDALGPAPANLTLPAVTAIVVSRDRGRALRLLDAVEKTDYPQLELIVVDNASPDGELARVLAERTSSDRWSALTSAPKVVSLEYPASFSEANNRGARLAATELLLFLNDDIEPVEPDWLRELVASLLDSEAAIAGATLVDARTWLGTGISASGWAVEQRGIEIGLGDEGFVPIRRDAGEDVFGARFGVDWPAAAVPGACLLVSKARFLALGEFDTGYQYGLEDIDLCLRATTRGLPVVCSGRSIVLHEGSGSQREAGREFRRINRAVNRRRFRQLWGPTLRRQRLAGLLRGDPTWGEAPSMAIARTSNDPDRGWGDYYTAIELGEAVAQLGWEVSYLEYEPERTDPIQPHFDVAVILTDRWDSRLFSDTTLVLAWIRNWTDRWLTRPWLDRVDVLLASSRRSADLLQQATGRTAEVFPLATNPRRFRPPRPGTPRLDDWVFTGNRWGEPRAIEAALSERAKDRAAVYGRGWESVAALHQFTRGPVPYLELPTVYGSAKLVLDDTAEPTLAYDAVNARVYDALACGALPLTNCVGGVRELFDDDYPTWSSAVELAAQIDALLESPSTRDELASRYRQIVLARHTYQHRARELRRIVAEQNERLSFCLKIGAPDREQAQRWGDLHFASALGGALRRLGHRWKVDVLPEWDSPQSSTFDVVIHIRGRSEYRPVPGQLNVLWLISHPGTFDDSLAEGYDLICVASAPFAAELRDRLEVPVQILEQATDPRVFFPDRDPTRAHDLVFVGNSRGVTRKILDDLLPTDHDLAIWGSGWAGTPAEAYLRGEYVPNDELRKVYSSAAAVLCDHWPDMRAAGFRSNRLYDALACGTLVVSDRVAGLDHSLGDAVLTYEDPDELRYLLDQVLADPTERERRTSGARDVILRGETFDDRARDLLRWVLELRR